MDYKDVKAVRENPYCDRFKMTTKNIKEMQELISVAIEKQIPSKLKDKGGYLKCEACGSALCPPLVDCDGTGSPVEIKYCPECGQKIDWED